MVCNRNTVVGIKDNLFTINGKVTYTPEAGFPNASKWVKGRLMMLKTANCIFDDERYPEWGSDENPYFGYVSWDYPDGKWDPDRNTDEFIKQLPVYKKHGLMMINVNMMGNQPTGRAASHPWINSAYTLKGDLKPAYLKRLSRVLDAADRLGMVVMIGLFYPQQDQNVMVQDTIEKDDALIRKCIVNVMEFLVASGHRNILIEIGNESTHPLYEHWMLRGERVYDAIKIAREASENLFPISTSIYEIDDLSDRALDSMDYILLHNFVGDPVRFEQQVKRALQRVGNKKPIINKEDTSIFCMTTALENSCSFGLFHMGVDNYREGFQSVPINWEINTVGKWNYFNQVARLTGSERPELPEDLEDAPEITVKGIKDGDVIKDLKDFAVEVTGPEYFSEVYDTLYLQRVEFFIDDHPVKYSGTTVDFKEVSNIVWNKPAKHELTGADLVNGPLEFNINNLEGEEHTLQVIAYYLEKWLPTGVHVGCFRERTAKMVNIKFRYVK